MKKLVIAFLPLLIACSSGINKDKSPEARDDRATASEITSEDIITPASYTPKLEAKKWNGIKDMTDETFKSDVLSSSSVTLVDFNATWCGPCRQQKPILDKLVKEYQGKINFASVDVDVCPQTAQQYRISSIPTLAFVQNATVGSSSIGLTSYDQLKMMIEKALQKSK